MKRGNPVLLAVVLCLFLEGNLTPFVWGAPRAWLLARDGNAAKVDLVQNVVIATTVLPSGEFLPDEMAVDPVRGNLFVLVGSSPYYVIVYDVKTLKRKGGLDFTVDEAPTAFGGVIRFIFPPTGSVFFARWWNPTADGGNGAFEVVTIDAGTFKTTARRVTTPPLAEKLMLDITGQTLYSMTPRKPAHIDVFDFPSFTKTSTIDLEAFVNPGAFGRDITDFKEGKLLFLENIKTLPTDPSRYSLFVFDIGSGRISPKAQTGLRGEARLLPRTNRVLFNEATDLAPGKGMVRPGKDVVYSGRIHVYDATTGTRVATVAVSDVWLGDILGVNPTEDACYYFSQQATGKKKLSVIDLRSYAVVKEVPLNSYADRMVLFDE